MSLCSRTSVTQIKQVKEDGGSDVVVGRRIKAGWYAICMKKGYWRSP